MFNIKVSLLKHFLQILQNLEFTNVITETLIVHVNHAI